MKEFLRRILPRISEQSQRLDNLALLTDHPWVEVSEAGDRTLYIFRSKDNELLVSKDGEVTSCSWEYLEYANSLLIEVDGNRRLYQQGFIDPAVLVLRLDGQEEFLTLVNQNKIDEVQAKQVQAWLERKYLPEKGNIPTSESEDRAKESVSNEADTDEEKGISEVEYENVVSGSDSVESFDPEELQRQRKNRDQFIFFIFVLLLIIAGAILTLNA